MIPLYMLMCKCFIVLLSIKHLIIGRSLKLTCLGCECLCELASFSLTLHEPRKIDSWQWLVSDRHVIWILNARVTIALGKSLETIIWRVAIRIAAGVTLTIESQNWSSRSGWTMKCLNVNFLLDTIFTLFPCSGTWPL